MPHAYLLGNATFQFIKLECGIRQGGVLFPYLFSVYIDDVIIELQQLNIGCHIKGTFVGMFLYADDIILLAPSVNSLQQQFFYL